MTAEEKLNKVGFESPLKGEKRLRFVFLATRYHPIDELAELFNLLMEDREAYAEQYFKDYIEQELLKQGEELDKVARVRQENKELKIDLGQARATLDFYKNCHASEQQQNKELRDQNVQKFADFLDWFIEQEHELDSATTTVDIVNYYLEQALKK